MARDEVRPRQRRVATVQFANSIGDPHVAIDRNGKIIVAGTGFNGTGLFGPQVARFTASGALDTTFNSTGVYSRLNTSQVRIDDVATDSSNRVVLVGENVGGTSGSFHVAPGAIQTINTSRQQSEICALFRECFGRCAAHAG